MMTHRLLAITVATLLGLPGAASAQPEPAPDPLPDAPQPEAPQPDATPTDASEPAAPQPEVSQPEPASPQPATVDSSAVGAMEVTQSAQSWMIGIAPRLGVNLPTSELETFVVVGLELNYVLPLSVLPGQLIATGDISFTRPNRDERITDPRTGPGSYDLDTTELKFAIGGVYRIFGFDKRLVPFAGAGAIMQLLKTTEQNSFNPDENTAQDTAFGFELLGGVDYRLGPGFVLGEVRFSYTDLDHLFTGNSNAGNFAISAGYRVTL